VNVVNVCERLATTARSVYREYPRFSRVKVRVETFTNVHNVHTVGAARVYHVRPLRHARADGGGGLQMMATPRLGGRAPTPR
jgi:hypothetical protein